MSVEGLLFYGLIIPGNDPAWRRLRKEYDDDLDRMLVVHFHRDLLEDKEWAKLFKRFGGNYRGALQQKLLPEAVFGGCRINGYGDLRKGSSGSYVAVCEAEIIGPTEGTRVDSKLIESPARREWKTRIRHFCERLGIGYSEPSWQLAFWWC